MCGDQKRGKKTHVAAYHHSGVSDVTVVTRKATETKSERKREIKTEGEGERER